MDEQPEKERWKAINIKGLERYQISNLSNVRIKWNKQILPKKDEIYIRLLRYSKSEMFLLERLFRITFDPAFTEDDLHQKFMSPDPVFSKNEDDYGLGGESVHWQELRKEVVKIKFIQESIDKSEES